ncbi:STAS-like domain-containing protein [Mucilaginibacter sp. 14171R-50]|uniref:STAS-like domain-containing protein n=1 Tax=Mucilaginibacter sp. 14171R-50 TaxID=2703789 RepID=UPI00138D35AD|nr:STAS-like domain-containing protein [Mucilaginibacter sp. 14171R-50]QHS57753.1 STAS-like domain-containing protein [Mucilaginibacter sp. 14171R-50]
MSIKIVEVINSRNAMFHPDGLKLYTAIINELNNGAKKVQVDFSDIMVLTTQFLNASFGKLMMEKGMVYFYDKVDVISTDHLKTYNEKFNWVVDNIKNKDSYKPFLNMALS